MKKILLSGILLLMVVSSIALAKTVEVSGSGDTRDAAINDAKRNAVEKVVGSYITSITVLNSSYVLKDEVYSKAYGFVKDIQILSETKGLFYEVKAKVDVDDSPNSQLMNKLETLRVLNNPRISVFINHNITDKNSKKSVKYTSLCETIIIQKLKEMGFTKIVDKAKVWQKKNEGRGEVIISKDGIVKSQKKSIRNKIKINDGQFVNNSGQDSVHKNVTKRQTKQEIPKPGAVDYVAYLPNSDTDYFIYGSLEFTTSKVMHPVFEDMREEKMSNFDTGFQKTTATLEIKILKSDTMEQIGIYSLDAASVYSDSNVAERDAVQKVANNAAEKIAESFAQKGASAENGFELQVCIEQKNLEKLFSDVKKISAVKNVRLRNYYDGKAYYEVEGDINPFDLFKALQQKSRLRVTKLSVSDNLLDIIVR